MLLRNETEDEDFEESGNDLAFGQAPGPSTKIVGITGITILQASFVSLIRILANTG